VLESISFGGGMNRCTKCGNEVGSSDKLFRYWNVRDKLITFNVGEVAVVFTRRLVVSIVLTVLLIL
jgi:hypothetical protein